MTQDVVHVQISDRGWILEKLASELSSRLPYLSYDDSPNHNAELQYYMTYGCWRHRISPVEVAWFTHQEEDPEAAQKFENVARSIDFCITHSIEGRSVLKAIDESICVETISPGVDLDAFRPKLRIGVVGRTYHTGRKGEALIREVMDIQDIEWHFTGEGWPGPARFVESSELPSFYRSLDYVLVSSLVEGGPMCVLEALASGCKVIAPRVGWVSQFPHVEFKLGDAADLRRVLLELLEEKKVLQRSVSMYTWDNFAHKHHQLFQRLLGRPLLPDFELSLSEVKETEVKRQPVQRGDAKLESVPPVLKSLNSSENDLRVGVTLHDRELKKSRGGPSVRAPRTVSALQQLGVQADLYASRDFNMEDVDILHVFNVWPPHACEVLLAQAMKHHCVSVLSPIFLDLTESRFFREKLNSIFIEADSIEELFDALDAMRLELEEHHKSPLFKQQPFPRYFSSIRRLANYASHLILLSDHERNLLRQIGVEHPSCSVVKNPVDASIFDNADPRLFSEEFGVSDYVLCVGRIEWRKNQALLALALRDTDLPLVFVGHEGDVGYLSFVKKYGNNRTVFVDRVEPNSPLLASAYAGARVFCLPSWSEGAPLVALEAAASGCTMVLSDRSSESEYFGDLARYVDPSDPGDIRTKVLEAYEESFEVRYARAQALKDLVRTEHSWETYAQQTLAAYRLAQTISVPKKQNSDKRRIFIDVSTLAYHSGVPTGISRVEAQLAKELGFLLGERVRYIYWVHRTQQFAEVARADVEKGTLKAMAGSDAADAAAVQGYELDIQKGDIVISMGSAWMRNHLYVEDLSILKITTGAVLVTMVHDVIQYKMQALYPGDISGIFIRNCDSFLRASDAVLACSEQTKRDIRTFCLDKNIPIPPINVFREGDEASNTDPNAVLARETITDLDNKPFVLYVSSIDIRKNHRFLVELWWKLFSEYGDEAPTLVLVGRIGWRGAEFFELLDTHPEVQEKILHLQNINDLTLDWLYNHCLFTVYPSRYEGWGLPVAESLRRGKFCIASDGGSLSEVAPGYAEYIDPIDFIAWYDALVKYSFNHEALKAKEVTIQGYKSTTWRESAQQIASYLEKIQGNDYTQLPSLGLNQTISFAAEAHEGQLDADEFVLRGWGMPEPEGCWTVGERAVFGFQMDEADRGDWMLCISAHGYTPDRNPVEVEFAVNGVSLLTWFVDGKCAEYKVIIPHSVARHDDLYCCTLKIHNPRSPANCEASPDTRMLGIHVRQVMLRSSVIEEPSSARFQIYKAFKGLMRRFRGAGN
ncbi:MAG: hypothetical protein Tsb0018_07050 [Opitutales bacterium]